MKLATIKNARPDGQLVVVSRELDKFVSAGRIVPTLQAALDDWDNCAPRLEVLSQQLNSGDIAGQPFEVEMALAPLPRAYQWIDGAGYLSHLERVRDLKGSKDTELQSVRPLMYQGGSDSLSSATDPIRVPSNDLAIDFEAEVAVITGPVPMSATPEQAQQAIRLITICNDVSLRRLVVDDLEKGFGFFHAKPSTSFAPVVATPDELGEAWQNNRLHLKVQIHVNGELFGQPNAGVDMHFDFVDLIVAAAQTRCLGAGTIMGSGAIANTHDQTLPIKKDEIGFACIAEARTVEKIKFGKAKTAFLKHGDRVKIAALDGNDIQFFGAIEQTVDIISNDS